MNAMPLWRVYAELPVPTIRPHDHHATLHQALSGHAGVISAETLIIEVARKHHVAATIVVAAAGRLARNAIQSACATARLPTGPLRTIKTERISQPANTSGPQRGGTAR